MVIPIFPICRNPNYFDEPNKFRPERFFDEQIMERKNPFAYIPFSAGPRYWRICAILLTFTQIASYLIYRNCIGQKYAMFEMKCILSKILQNFEISLAKESEGEPTLSGTLVLRSENAILFHLKRRNWNGKNYLDFRVKRIQKHHIYTIISDLIAESRAELIFCYLFF